MCYTMSILITWEEMTMKKLVRMFAKSLLGGILPISLLLGGFPVSAYTGNSAKALTSGADIRVMSYNVLVDNDEENGGWSWGQALGTRGDKASAAIAYYQPDVIGFQECNYNWHVSLKGNLSNYAFVNADVPEVQKLEKAESLGKKDWMCTTMMYNTDTLELVNNELIGYSVNYWGCIQRMRYLSMAVFKVKATGETFVFTSTHFDAENYADGRGQKNRVTQATEMAENIQRYKETYGCPIISTGDFNSSYNDDPITKIREMTGMTSHSNNRGGIDYILFSEGVTAKYFTVVNDSDLRGASDHSPIFADLALDDGFAFPTTTTTTEATTTTTTTTATTGTTRTAWKSTVTTTSQPTAYVPTVATKTQSVGTTAATGVSVATDSVPATTAVAVTDPTGIDAPLRELLTLVRAYLAVNESVAVDIALQSAMDETEAALNSGDSQRIDAAYAALTQAYESFKETVPTGDATDSADGTPTSTATTPVAENADKEVEAEIVKKGNDELIYIGIAAAVVAIGAVVAFVLLRKKK